MLPYGHCERQEKCFVVESTVVCGFRCYDTVEANTILCFPATGRFQPYLSYRLTESPVVGDDLYWNGTGRPAGRIVGL
jgi:hypothetical protein